MKEEDFDFMREGFKNQRYMAVYLTRVAQDYGTNKLNKKSFARILRIALESMEN